MLNNQMVYHLQLWKTDFPPDKTKVPPGPASNFEAAALFCPAMAWNLRNRKANGDHTFDVRSSNVRISERKFNVSYYIFMIYIILQYDYMLISITYRYVK